MQNILLSGFEDEPNKKAEVGDNRITAKLGDLGIVMEPAKGLVQPIVYRAPEVYFRNEINKPADIWSWGLIYCQLLEAQASFNKYGIYDELLQGNTGQGQKERSVERAIAHDFGLNTLDYYDGCRLPYHDRSHHEGQHWDRLIEKGVPEKEIKFLTWVLNPVPTDRPTAQQILDAGWFTMDTARTSKIAETLGKSAQESRRRNVHRKRSEPLLTSYSTPIQQPAGLYTREVPTSFATSTSTSNTKPWSPTPVPWHPQSSQSYAPQSTTSQAQAQGAGQASQPTSYQPMPFKPVTMQAKDELASKARPVTPRSATQKPGGSTFLNFGSFMR
jgi:protein kinase